MPDAAMDNLLFLTTMLGRKVCTVQGQPLGIVRDLVADVRQYRPPVSSLVLDRRGGLSGALRRFFSHYQRVFLPWSAVEDISGSLILVQDSAIDKITLDPPSGAQLLLKHQLLDRQIVDTAGAKVVRVNDLQLSVKNRQLILARVDVGLKGLMRRVGLEGFLNSLLALAVNYRLGDSLIPWNMVQTVGSEHILQLRISQTRLSRLHPADLADIIEDLDPRDRERLFKAFDIEMAADILEETDHKVQLSLIQSVPEETASDILDQMSPDEAADILQGLSKDKAENLLQEMEEEQAEDVRWLLKHDEETAGGLMTTDFLSVSSQTTVSQVLEQLRQQADLDVFYYVYVEDSQEHLMGVVSLRDLLTASPEARVGVLMNHRPVTAELDADEDEVMDLFVKYGLRAIPVLDQDGRIHGVIRLKALLETMAGHL